jgi:hypothetical protein
MSTCPITVWRAKTMRGQQHGLSSPCGEPVERFGLCAKHAADKVRLGGAPDAA